MLRAAQHDNNVERGSLPVFLVIVSPSTGQGSGSVEESRPPQMLNGPHQDSSV